MNQQLFFIDRWPKSGRFRHPVIETFALLISPTSGGGGAKSWADHSQCIAETPPKRGHVPRKRGRIPFFFVRGEE